MHGYRIFKQKMTQSALPEHLLLALNETKIGKFGICFILKQRRLQCTDSSELSLFASMRKKSGRFVAFESNEGSVEFLPMHRLACAFADGINEKKKIGKFACSKRFL